jgi:transcriptional regulator with XRE-family HTH domain
MGARIAAARHRLEWSRETLAHHSGLSWSAIEQIESGRRRNARPGTLRSLASALGVTIDYLVNGGTSSGMFDHQVLVYRDDAGFLTTVAPFLAEGLERSEALMAITTRRNIALLREELGKGADEVGFVDAETWYRSPAEALNALRVVVDEKLEGRAWARIVGEPVWSGRSADEVRAWHQYESLLNLTLAQRPVTVLCPYDERSVDPAVAKTALSTHPQTLDGRTLAENPGYRDPSEFVLGRSGS